MACMLGTHLQSLFGECGIVINKKWAYILMMFWCMMFAGVVSAIEDTLLPKILELALRMPTFEPMKALIHQFGGLESHCVPIVRPWAVMLLMVTGVGVGWKWLSSSNVVQSGVASLQP
jgi:hypothetical protein